MHSPEPGSETQLASLEEVGRFDEPSFLINPYPVYARLRREAPVWWCERSSAWVITRYEDVRAVLQDGRTFSSAPQSQEKYSAETGMIILTDPPKHGPARRMFVGAGSYRAQAVAEWKTEIRATSQHLVRALPDGEFEAVTEVAVPAVVRLFERFFDLPQSDPDRWSWKDALLTEHYATDAECIPDLLDYLLAVVQARRENPGADAISVAVVANDRDRLLSDDEMAWNFYDAILAGAASTIAVTAEAIGTLAARADLQDPEYWTDEASKVSVEELLRWVTHIHWTNIRTATRDVELLGQPIRAGDLVTPVIASANRDEHVWPNAEELDLTRNPTPPNLAFGYGRHIATGTTLARGFLATLLPILLEKRRPMTLAGEIDRARQVGISTPRRVPVA